MLICIQKTKQYLAIVGEDIRKTNQRTHTLLESKLTQLTEEQQPSAQLKTESRMLASPPGQLSHPLTARVDVTPNQIPRRRFGILHSPWKITIGLINLILHHSIILVSSLLSDLPYRRWSLILPFCTCFKCGSYGRRCWSKWIYLLCELTLFPIHL
jgi:hypothetical protein